MKCLPSSVSMTAVALLTLPVSRCSPATKSTAHGPPRLTRADSAPEVNTAMSSSQYASPLPGSSAGPGSSSNRGCLGVPPAKWVISTPMTSGMGVLNDSVTAGPRSRSPRCRMRCVGAYTTSDPGPAVASRTSAGWQAWTPLRISQKPSLNFIGHVLPFGGPAGVEALQLGVMRFIAASGVVRG